MCIWTGKNVYRSIFYLLWNTAINANVFSDNNEAIWNTRINDITCIEPSQLSEYNNLLVVTFVKNDFAIRNRLKNLGITNIIDKGEENGRIRFKCVLWKSPFRRYC